MKNMKVGILGCAGRNGRLLLKEVYDDASCYLAGGTVREGGTGHGEDLGVLAGVEPLGVYAHAQPGILFENADVVIDFTQPDVTMGNVELAITYNKPIVIGTTGFSDEQRKLIIQKSDKVPILLASNMTLGIGILSLIVEKVAEALDESFDIEIHEIHHKFKKDSPSGTAKSLVRAANRGRKNEDKNAYVQYQQSSQEARPKGAIGVSVSRGGNEIGTHTVSFYGEEEMIELKHTALNRRVFAKGALRAAKWLYGRSAGVYRLKDVLKDTNWSLD